MTRTRTAFALAAGATGTLVALSASPALADSHTATVSVLHAVPDTPVDVYANGERLIDDFQPGTLTDPLELPAAATTSPSSRPTHPTAPATRCCPRTASTCRPGRMPPWSPT
jgi:hypothetical protein